MLYADHARCVRDARRMAIIVKEFVQDQHYQDQAQRVLETWKEGV